MLVLIGIILTAYYLFFAQDNFATLLFASVAFIAITGLAAAICLFVGNRAGDGGRPWTYLGFGCLIWFAGEVVWSLCDLVWHVPPPIPLEPDVLFYPIFAVGLALIVRANMAGSPTMEIVLDGLIVGTVSGILGYELLFGPLFRAGAEIPLELALTFVYVAGTCALLFLALVALIWRDGKSDRRSLTLLFLGMVAYTVANVVYGRLDLEERYYLGHPIDLGWFFVLLLVSAAALVAHRHGVAPRRHALADDRDPSASARTVIVIISVVIGTGLGVFHIVTGDAQELDAAAAAAVGLIVAVRLAYAAVQSRQLRDRTRERDRLAREAAVAAATEVAMRLREVELGDARDQALVASRVKSEFLATMSHEVRTPMNGVMGMLELLNETPLSPQQRDFAEAARESAAGLLGIINDILDFSRMEAGKLLLETIAFAPTAVVEGAADVVAGAAQARGLALLTFVSPEIPRGLQGDPGRLRQVLVNLIGNAVKFTEQGEIVVRAELVQASETEVTLRFTVADTGRGLSPAARARLFLPFVQADASTTREYGGTGLGLAIAKRLVDQMYGQIGVESEEGQGSTFWFTARFPRAGAATLPPPPHEGQTLAGLRVLVVDANPTSRDIVHTYILSWGMRNGRVVTSDQALALLRKAAASADPYDVAIIDLAGDESDDAALARHVRDDPHLASTRLILLAELDQHIRGERALDAGFAAYITKPMRQSRLFDAIADAVADRVVVTDRGQEGHAAVPAAAPNGVHRAAPIGGGLILLAEDNPVNQRVAQLQLEKLGYAVETVANGLQAVAAAARGEFVMVLMDVQMPEMDGLAATMAIREAEISTGRRLPIIAMTANAMEGDREICIRAGMDDYISKPVNREMLREVLARWMPQGAKTKEVAVT